MSASCFACRLHSPRRVHLPICTPRSASDQCYIESCLSDTLDIPNLFGHHVCVVVVALVPISADWVLAEAMVLLKMMLMLHLKRGML